MEYYTAIVFLLLLVCLAAAYVYFMALTMAYAASSKEFSLEVQHVKADIARIESEYFTRTNAITIADAHTFDLSSVSERHVVDVHVESGVALRGR